jgi:hypothetical protein
MQFNYITTNSGNDSKRLNAYSWTEKYTSYVTFPKSVSLLSASIPVTFLSFKQNQLSLYMNVYNNVYTIKLTNGYYDDINEFLPMLNTATATALGNNDFTWSYSTANQCLKLSCSGTTSFQIKSYLYASDSLAQRLGFIDNVDYNSYLEGGVSVVYAEGVLRLARTTGFYIVSSLVPYNNCACPDNSIGVIDYIPIQYKDVAYGDVITVTRSALTTNQIQLKRSEQYNASSEFIFQVMDDEFNLIDDKDRGGDTVLFLQCDYD